MSAISTTASSGKSAAAFLANPPSTPVGDAPQFSDPAGEGDRGAATHVQLSDNVKAILARATTDQVVAERLQSFVESRRSGGPGNSPSMGDTSKINVSRAFQQLSGGSQASDASQAEQSVQLVRNFATGLKADGYTIAALASNVDGSSRITIIGPNGFNFLDEHFGRSDEFMGGLQGGPGLSESATKTGNVEYISITQNSAEATSVEASSAAGTTSVSWATAQSNSVTIAIDFNTGSISLTQSETISASITAQISRAGSSVSTVA